MSLLGACARNVVHFHDITCHSTLHRVSLGSRLVDIVNIHGVANELGRGGREYFDLRNVISWVQWVISISFGLEFDDLGRGKWQVVCLKIGLVLVETDVKSSWTRSVDIPIRIGELLLVNFLGAMKLWDSTC